VYESVHENHPALAQLHQVRTTNYKPDFNFVRYYIQELFKHPCLFNFVVESDFVKVKQSDMLDLFNKYLACFPSTNIYDNHTKLIPKEKLPSYVIRHNDMYSKKSYMKRVIESEEYIKRTFRFKPGQTCLMFPYAQLADAAMVSIFFPCQPNTTYEDFAVIEIACVLLTERLLQKLRNQLRATDNVVINIRAFVGPHFLRNLEITFTCRPEEV